MPECDTLAAIARRLQPLTGHVLRVETPLARHAPLRLPERLTGATLERVESRGKHLLLTFSNELIVHSHLRMSGRWEIGKPGRALRRPRSTAWLILASDEVEAVLFNGPVLEVLTPAQASLHPALRRLGGDVLDASFDVEAAVAVARGGPSEQTVADVLLDQRALAGVGNVWKSEALFDLRLDPWTRVAHLNDDALGELLQRASDMMRAHVASGALRRPVRVYGRANRPCPRCGARIRARAQGDEGRRTYWCPTCQVARG